MKVLQEKYLVNAATIKDLQTKSPSERLQKISELIPTVFDSKFAQSCNLYLARNIARDGWDDKVNKFLTFAQQCTLDLTGKEQLLNVVVDQLHKGNLVINKTSLSWINDMQSWTTEYKVKILTVLSNRNLAATYGSTKFNPIKDVISESDDRKIKNIINNWQTTSASAPKGKSTTGTGKGTAYENPVVEHIVELSKINETQWAKYIAGLSEQSRTKTIEKLKGLQKLIGDTISAYDTST